MKKLVSMIVVSLLFASNVFAIESATGEVIVQGVTNKYAAIVIRGDAATLLNRGIKSVEATEYKNGQEIVVRYVGGIRCDRYVGTQVVECSMAYSQEGVLK